MVTTTTATRKPNPQTFNSPSTDQIVGNLVSGLPYKEKGIHNSVSHGAARQRAQPNQTLWHAKQNYSGAVGL